MTKDFVELVKQALNDVMPSYSKKGDGLWEIEIYADYRDEMSDEDAYKIATSNYPEQELLEILDYAYMEADSYYRGQVLKEVKDWLEEGEYEYDPDELNDVFNDMVYCKLPEEHFLEQEFKVDILVDTGDANRDFCCNSRVAPCWYGSYGGENYRFENEASLVWLARQQGYTKTQLQNWLKSETDEGGTPFLRSVYRELANHSSQVSALCFLVKMTLRELIEVNKLIKMQDRNGRIYDARMKPYCGYIIIDKDVECGIYDPWNGGGSLLEIQLEKDVRLPGRFIYSAVPDKMQKNCSIDRVYGLVSSAWKNAVKEIHEPK